MQYDGLLTGDHKKNYKEVRLTKAETKWILSLVR